jgi:hypothetical protein
MPKSIRRNVDSQLGAMQEEIESLRVHIESLTTYTERGPSEEVPEFDVREYIRRTEAIMGNWDKIKAELLEQFESEEEREKDSPT